MPETQGGHTKFFPADKDLFHEDGDTWWCLNAGWEVTKAEDGLVIDVWNPETGNYYESDSHAAYGVIEGNREATFEMPPDVKAIEDMTEEELKAAGKEVSADIRLESHGINALRRHQYAKGKRYNVLRREYKSRKRVGYQRRYYVAKRYPVYTGAYRVSSSSTLTSGIFGRTS